MKLQALSRAIKEVGWDWTIIYSVIIFLNLITLRDRALDMLFLVLAIVCSFNHFKLVWRLYKMYREIDKLR